MGEVAAMDWPVAWYGHALKDADGKWLTQEGYWSTDFARAAVYVAYPPITAIFSGDKVAVHAVRVKITFEEVEP